MADILKYRQPWEFPEGSAGYHNARIREKLAELAAQGTINPDLPTQDQSTQGEQ